MLKTVINMINVDLINADIMYLQYITSAFNQRHRTEKSLSI